MILIFAQSTIKEFWYLRGPRLPRTRLDALECDLVLKVDPELVLRAFMPDDELSALIELHTSTVSQSHSDGRLLPDVV